MTTSRLRVTLLQHFDDRPPKILGSWPADDVHAANRLTSKLLTSGYCGIPASQLGFNVSPESATKVETKPKKEKRQWLM